MPDIFVLLKGKNICNIGNKLGPILVGPGSGQCSFNQSKDLAH